MFHQTIIGKPKCCLNRNCKTQFTKSSHLGWLPKSEVEVYAIMRCPKCKDTFAVVQLISMAHDYRNDLPADQTKISKEKIISIVENFRPEVFGHCFVAHVTRVEN